jgi:3-isopropylmalate dehydrogenase
MLRFSFGEETAAQAIEAAVRRTIDDGFRTRDIWTDGPGVQLVNTREMAAAVTDRL